mmetsp:Transcript_14923/g.17133  ORF Transcript_14923/g.17133 Transcript_14923/m.17133 type:complete len:1037 (+) Transcript_14923:89-3199(+)
MWGKLAQGLGEHAGDLRNGLAKLSDAVAPAVDEDIYEEYEEEEYNDGEDSDDEEYEHVKEMTVNLKKGFASLISRIAPTDDDNNGGEEIKLQMKELAKDIVVAQRSSLVENEGKSNTMDRSFKQRKQMHSDMTVFDNNVEKKNPFHSGTLVSHFQQNDSFKKNSALDVSLVCHRNQIRASSPISARLLNSPEITKKTEIISITKDSSIPLNKICTLKENDVTRRKYSVDSSNHKSVSQKLKEKSNENENENEDLQQKCNEPQLTIDPDIVKEKDILIQSSEQKYNALQSRINVDNDTEKGRYNLIQELEQKCQELQSNQAMLTSIVNDKESQIRTLEQNCTNLHLKVVSDTTLAKEKDKKINDLDQKCKDLKSVPVIDPMLINKKNDQIRNLEEQCRKLKLQPVPNTSAVTQNSNQIQELKQKCRDLKDESSSESMVMKNKDTQIKVLQHKCSELQLEATRRHHLVEKKDAHVNELQKRLHELKTQSTALNIKIQKCLELEEKCSELSDELEKVKDEAAIAGEKSEVAESRLKEKEKLVYDLEQRYTDLEGQLRQREENILKIQKKSAEHVEKEGNWRESQLLKFKQEQAIMIEATSESVSSGYRQQIDELKIELLQQKQKSQDQWGKEKMNAIQKQRHLEHLLEESNARIAKMEATSEIAFSKQQNMMKQELLKHEHASKMSNQKQVETKSVLDDRNDELKSLKAMLTELKSKMRETMENQGECEEELEHLREENETLHHNWQVTEDENEELKKQLNSFSCKDDVIDSLKKEMHHLKHVKDCKQASIASKIENVESSNAKLQADCDAACANVRNLEHQLAAALADSEVAKCDMERIMKGNTNLNNALESLQSERDVEILMLEEEHKSSFKMVEAARAASMQVTIQMNESKLKDVQYAADTEINRMIAKFDKLKGELENVKKEKFQTRRSLDEAISRLQASQEDIVDRSMMKNVLLDWFARSGKSKCQVLEVMASLLHFSEEEKEKVHLYGGSSGISKVVESVATLPPAATDVQNLEGDNVQDKWVNFLLAETEDS